MSEKAYHNASLVGHPAPQFVAHSTRGIVDLSAYEGSWVLLFCHPADFTPVCTTEFISLAKNKPEFDKLGVELIGLSVDSVYSHLNWIDWIEEHFDQNITFPVIEDSSMEISKAYGMIDETSINTSTVRSCVFIDPDQNIQALIHYPMQVGRSIPELLRVQHALIATFEVEAAVPANWSPGEKTIETPLEHMLEKPSGWLKRILTAQTIK
jgi:peroxiredoxin (alkyl hydroperoxide reductase subunit C)